MRAMLTSVEGTTRAGRALGNAHDMDRAALPILLTVDEAAELLRTTRRAIYVMLSVFLRLLRSLTAIRVKEL